MNTLRIRTLKLVVLMLVVMFPFRAYGEDLANPDDLAIVELIAKCNRANRQMLNSLDCNYHVEIAGPDNRESPLRKDGRFAFAGDKVYLHEQIAGTENYITHVQNGSGLRQASKGDPRIIEIGTVGKATIKPGTPDPWTMLDGGLSMRLDAMKDEDGSVVAVSRQQHAGSPCVILDVKRSMPGPTGEPMPVLVKLYYSQNANYVPVRVEAKTEPGTSHEVGFAVDVRLLELSVNGSTCYMPSRITETGNLDGKEVHKVDYTIDEASVQVNPTLPDSLFTLDIQPMDHVVNQDLQMDVQNRYGLSLVEPYLDQQIKGNAIISEGTSSSATRPTTRVSHATGTTIELCAGVILELVIIPSGEFTMGSPDDEVGFHPELVKALLKSGRPTRQPHEGPPHRVTVSRDYLMGAYEVTCRQFRCFRPDYRLPPLQYTVKGGSELSSIRVDEPDQPAQVSWAEAKAFCEWLGQTTDLDVRLPSEEEWEYACRAGTSSRFFWGDEEQPAGQYANVADKTYARTAPDISCFETDDGFAGPAPVGRFRPSRFGLYDMLGNVPEWCADMYDPDSYSKIERKPGGQPSAQFRVHRGGGWDSGLAEARCAARGYADPTSKDVRIGFRVVVEGFRTRTTQGSDATTRE